MANAGIGSISLKVRKFPCGVFALWAMTKGGHSGRSAVAEVRRQKCDGTGAGGHTFQSEERRHPPYSAAPHAQEEEIPFDV